MEINNQNLQGLAQQLERTTAPDQNVIKQAEAFLQKHEMMPGFAALLIKLLSLSQVPENIRQAGAVFLKNLVARRWDPDNPAEKLNPDAMKVIKESIIDIMLATPRSVRTQLSATLAFITQCDFPLSQQWPTLLPTLIQKMNSGDYNIITCVLEVLVSICERYQYEERVIGSESDLEYAYILKHTQEPHLKLFMASCGHLAQAGNNAAQAKVAATALHLELKLFYLLNYQTIPAFFQDNIKKYMGAFQKLLQMKVPCLESKDPDQAGPMEQIKSTICQSVSVYVNKYEEEFGDMVGMFIQSIWALLTGLGEETKYDELVTSAIRFLNSVVKKPQYKDNFNNKQALESICAKVVMPQLKLRDADIEMFSMNGIEYVRRDMEGSDVNTRRRTTVDFVRGLMVHFEAEISGILKGYVQKLLAEYKTNRSNWIAKDAAMYTIVALSAQSSTKKEGVKKVNQYVNVMEFFGAEVVPEFNAKLDERPVLTADCLKFVIYFRNQLPHDAFPQLVQMVAAQLKSEEFVVHTYAAAALEKLLRVRGPNGPVISKAVIAPLAQPLLIGLFEALKKEDSKENEYVMRSILRVCSSAKEGIVAHAEAIIGQITDILSRVSKNPRNPTFNHYLFETLSCMIATICKVNAAAIAKFESSLFPIFQVMLGMETAEEFGSYVFQIMAMLLEFRQDLSQTYKQLYPSLLHAQLWEKHGNVPALTRLLRAYMQRGPEFVAPNLNPLLGIFQKLISVRRLDTLALELVGTIIEKLPMQAYQAQLTGVFHTIFQRLQKGRSNPFNAALTTMFSRFIIRHGPDTLINELNKAANGILGMLLDKIILPDINFVHGEEDRKIAAVGLTNLICLSPAMVQGPYNQFWTRCVDAIVTLFEQESKGNGNDEPDLLDLEKTGATTSFNQLAFAIPPDNDPVPGVADPTIHFAKNLAALMQKFPGKFGPELAKLDPKAQNALKNYAQKANVAFA